MKFTPISLLFLLLVSSSALFAQNPLVEEGMKLYRLEMASWNGTDIFLARFPEKSRTIGGYFSYENGDSVRCLFFSNEAAPKVIATISFDTTLSTSTAIVDTTERRFTSYEGELQAMRQAALDRIVADTLFKMYKNTNLNLIPLIEGDSKKMYVLTGPQVQGVVIFGNDYVLTFDKDNNVESANALHDDIVMVGYTENLAGDGESVAVTAHAHHNDNLITPTDICTLMLYGKFVTWKQHVVVGNKYVSVWNCETNSLGIVPRKAWDGVSSEPEEKEGEKIEE